MSDASDPFLSPPPRADFQLSIHRPVRLLMCLAGEFLFVLNNQSVGECVFDAANGLSFFVYNARSRPNNASENQRGESGDADKTQNECVKKADVLTMPGAGPPGAAPVTPGMPTSSTVSAA